MAESLPMRAADGGFGALVRRAARQHERFTLIEDESAAAVLISASELEDLEDALAVAQARLREATGESTLLTHDEVRRRLGFDS